IMHGPVFQSNKILKKVLFGNDNNNIYLRFDLLGHKSIGKGLNEIFIYFISPDEYEIASPMRIRNKGNSIPQPQKFSYSYELEMQFNDGELRQPLLSKALEYGLWKTIKS